RIGFTGRAAQRLEGGAEAARDREVVLHFAITLTDGQIHLYASRQGGSARATFDDGGDAFELGLERRAHGEFAGGVFGDDVDGLAAVGDVAVHAHAVAEV